MRIVTYVTVIAFALAMMLAFSTAPAVAERMSGPTMEQSGTTGEQKGQVSGQAQHEFSGEAKAGASQEKAREETKAGMKGKGEAEVSTERKTQKPGEARVGEETKAKMKTEEKAGVSAEEKGRMKTETKSEVGKKPEARVPGEEKIRREERSARPDVTPRTEGGVAVVVRVDRPDNCLRIRGDASASSEQIACVAEGERLNLTGVFSSDGRWAQLDNNGWVFFGQLETDVRPPQAIASERSWEKPSAAGKGARKAGMRYHGVPYHYYYAPGYYCPGYFSGSMYWAPGY
jgi:hypothetical protein